jgi:7-carboxy-7-deazaguanine synthase
MRLIEHYLSVQGEGLRSGKLTYFVRFARCNLRCSWCDSAYTFGEGEEIAFEPVTRAIEESRAAFVCLTGGEPLLHPEDCLKLIRHFPKLHFDLETGGSLGFSQFLLPNVSVIMDWKLEHSGMSGKMKEEYLKLLRPNHDLLKFVSDGSAEERNEILGILAKTEKSGVPVSIQPVHGADPGSLADWVVSLKNPRLQINLQLHKVLWPGAQSGV